MPYIGGFPVYVQKCNRSATNGFEGFVMEGADIGNEAPLVRSHRAMARTARHRVISPAAVAARRACLSCEGGRSLSRWKDQRGPDITP